METPTIGVATATSSSILSPSNEDARRPQDSVTDDVPTGDYWVGVALGEGSFGKVLHGRHKSTLLDVAIKVVDKFQLHKQPPLMQQLWRERSILQSLRSCRWTIDLWSAFHDAHHVYLVMECCHGGDLQQIIDQVLLVVSEKNNDDTFRSDDQNEQQFYFPTKMAPYYALQLVEAVQCLHQQHEIIHADLKPQNILVTAKGRIKISDFGSAVWMKSDNEGTTIESLKASSQSTSVSKNNIVSHLPNNTMGTMDYASPELLRGRPITEATDLWSLGCIFAAMHWGQSPFHASSDCLALEKIMAYVREEEEYRMDWLLLQQQEHWKDTTPSINNNCDDHDDGHSKNESVVDKWKQVIEGLLHPKPSQRLKLTDARFMIPDYASINLSKDPPMLPPTPQWVEDAKQCAMKDGKQGWAAFAL